MWTHSFWSVLIDLWSFFWRLDSSTNSTTYVSAAQSAVTPERTEPERLITLDTKRPQSVQLEAGTVYTAESLETILLRANLKAYDKHLVQSGNLQLIEWLLYNINQHNPSISLLALCMTPLGRWYQTIKNVPGTRVVIEPATGALMEWFDSDQRAHAALVEVVAPDETITICHVSQAPSGTFTKQVMSTSVWRELRPVFTCFR
jgi:hypothetical protein